MKKNSKAVTSLTRLFAALLFTVGLSYSLCHAKASLLDKEPIDVVIKYIDLTDPYLKRDGIPQIKKDEDNGELRYAVRSVLKNIPWVNKIYIVMPNEQVRYFKAPNSIKDKIRYIKDKDLLGFDSASSTAFQFNYWRLKKFGVSKNFISMDDDYFIGKPLKKSDFFYEDNGKIVPYVIYNERLGKKAYGRTRSYHKSLASAVNSSSAHSNAGFQYQKISSLMFLYSIFGKNMLGFAGDLAYFPHNALGYNMDELKEVYDLVKSNYKHAAAFLSAKKRTNNDLQHQTTYSFYVLNKHHRRVNKLWGSYIDLAYAPFANFNVPMFCINTGGNYTYSAKDYAQAKVTMNKLFPVATPYEKPVIKNGIYTIESALQRNKVLSVQSGSKNDGANIRLWNSINTTAQKFKVIRQHGGSYVIEPLCSGKRVDVAYSGKDWGTNIWQYSKNNSKAQKWYLIPSGKGTFNIVSATNHLCMDVDDAQTYNGTNIRCWEANGTEAQKFRFIKTH